MTIRSLTEVLADFVANTSFGDMPRPVIERAKVSLVHNLSVGLAGRAREPVAYRLAETAWREPETATLFWTGTRVSMEGAAFANAALMNARSQDDTHDASTSHPGSPTMGAAIAVAESLCATGADLLAAIVLGYEVLCRVGRDFDHIVTERGFRAASVFGGFGAAAASAKLMGLSAGEITHGFGLMANMAGGLTQVWREGSPEGSLQMAFAARNGLSAMRAAAVGAGAARQALDGSAGLYRAYAGASTAPAQAISGIGADWQILEATVKPLPVCAILQGPVAAFLDLAREHRLTAGDIATVGVVLSPFEADYPGIDFGGPFASSIATKMSTQFSIGLAMTDGRVTPDGLARVDDADVLSLAARVSVARDPAIANRLSRVDVALASGAVLTARVDAPVGRPSFDEVAKFARGLSPEMGATELAVDRLVEAVAALDGAAHVKDLIAAIVACGARPR
jgi:2-methylcitrate dehydratase PrpD